MSCLTPDELPEFIRLSHETWTSTDTAFAQARLTDGEIAAWEKGDPVAPYDALRRVLEPVRNDLALTMVSPSIGRVLDVGCGSGHYFHVLRRSLPGVRYHGCDYSFAMASVGRQKRWGRPFLVGDAGRLPYRDGCFGLVLFSSVLVHVPDLLDWAAMLRECKRVSRKWLVVHRTPVRSGERPTVWRPSEAYGGRSFQLHVGEGEWGKVLDDAGLRVEMTFRWAVGSDPEQWSQLCLSQEGL